ncbi:MAG: hypothetical protein AAB426_07615 [Myxococcota bacterium]
MAHAYRHRDRWYAAFTDHNGERRRCATKARTKKEAERLPDDLERRAERQRLGLEPLPVEDGETLGELVQWWLAEYSARLPSHERNAYVLRKHVLQSKLARQRVSKLTSGEVAAYLHRRGKTLGPQSLNHLRRYLLTMINRAREVGRFTGANPVVAVKRRKVPRPARDDLRPKEIPSVLAAVPERWRALFACASARSPYAVAMAAT